MLIAFSIPYDYGECNITCVGMIKYYQACLMNEYYKRPCRSTSQQQVIRLIDQLTWMSHGSTNPLRWTSCVYNQGLECD